MVISITNSSYIKSLPLATYRQQRRGGVGIIGMDMKEDDYIEHLFVCSTHDYLLFFTNRGKVYRSKVYDLPEAGRTSKGRYLGNVLPLREGERVQSVLATRDFSETRVPRVRHPQGRRQEDRVRPYNTPIKADGIIAINIRDDDELVAVRRVDPGDEILMVSHEGLTVRFREEDARAMGRGTSGVRGMDVSGKDNYVLAMDVARPGQDLLVVTENGYGKRTAIDEYRLTSRGAKGVKTINFTEAQGPARRRAGRARAPGARLHLPERHGPAHLGPRHQPLRPRVAGRARDEPARGRRGVAVALVVESRGEPTRPPAARRCRSTPRGAADEPGARRRRRRSSATRTRRGCSTCPRSRRTRCPTPTSRTSSRATRTPRAPVDSGALGNFLLDYLAVASWSKRPGGRTPAPATAVPRCGFR